MKYQAVIFDLDGTLADTIPLTIYAIKEAVKNIQGRELSDREVFDAFGPVDTGMLETFVPRERVSEAVELYVKIFEEEFDAFIRPIPGIVDLLQALSEENIKIGIFTGRGLRVSEIILDKLEIRSYFQVIVSGEMTKNPKPNPEGIFLALDRLQASSKESLYVGDFGSDIKASKAAGTTSVLALWSSTAKEKFIALNPDQYFRNTHDFLDWLKQN